MELNRKDKILKIIVEDFIKTATPVGSDYLIHKYNIPYSSATIRNEMNSLEKEGLLEKTHTSSGRVPSTEGYKYYVKYLKSDGIDSKLKSQIQQVFENSKSIEEVLGESCEILSSMTNLASVYLGPTSTTEALASVQLVPLSKNSATAIFITDRGYVENKTFIFDENVNMNDMKKCVSLIDERLRGTKIDQLVPKLDTIKPLLKDYIADYSYIFTSISKTFFEFAESRSEFYGTENLVNQPEFKDDASELKKLFDLFNDPEELAKMINKKAEDLAKEDGRSIESFDNVSVVSKDIKIPGQENDVGKIAVIGPKRMDYGRVLNALDYVVKEIMLHFNDLNWEDDKKND
ncbi:MAG: heat-inducible transcriptional repressor HrcA [Bacilli bacterium]